MKITISTSDFHVALMVRLNWKSLSSNIFFLQHYPALVRIQLHSAKLCQKLKTWRYKTLQDPTFKITIISAALIFSAPFSDSG